MISKNLNDIAILKIKCSGYHYIICLISESEAIKLFKKCWFDWKKWNIIKLRKEILTLDNIEIEKNKF